MTLAELLCSAYVALALPNADTACMNMDTVIESSYKHKVDASIMTALIFYESRWKPKAISSSRACGLTQVLPKYTRNPRRTCKELLDPTVSIDTGAKTLGQWLHGRYAKGRMRLLCALTVKAIAAMAMMPTREHIGMPATSSVCPRDLKRK